MVVFVAVIAALLAQTPDVATNSIAHHAVVAAVDPAAGTVSITDRLRVPSSLRTITVELHSGLAPGFVGATVATRRVDGDVETFTLTVDAAKKKAATNEIVITAKGRIVHAPEQVATEHQRSFQETAGIVEARGVYLSPSSRWLPTVVDGKGEPWLITGSVRVEQLSAGWRALSEGGFNDTTQTWEQTTPVDGLHLIAGPFHEVKKKLRGVDVLVWTRMVDGKPADDANALSDRYLEVTGQYLTLYGDLIGAYPYPKFALVENFWETGYGMPSFTLLGPQVVRFPFILHTSWPHELLHNWWGNGVFPVGGNWSEGLTAYLADHLNDERQGRGADHRRTTIQRYLDFVLSSSDGDSALDFPLVEFRNRFSAASEAIGYGKTLMVFHMLRRQLGDDVFKRGLQTLWKDKKFQRASFVDVAAAFSKAAGVDVGPFFAAWTTTKGIPSLSVVEVSEQVTPKGTRSVRVVVEQRGPALPMSVPVVLTTTDGRSVSSIVAFDVGGDASAPRRASVNVPVPAALARVDVDPFFDVFRRLSPDEVPPSLSRAFGAKKMLLVTPTRAPAEEIGAWTAFAKSICPDAVRCTIVDDKKVQSLPNDAAVWVLGYGNLLRAGPYVLSKPFDVRFDDRGFFGPGGWQRVMDAKDRKAVYDVERSAPEKTGLAVVVEHPNNRALAMTFVGSPSPSMIPLLAKKLPHYGKYGAVGFAGDAADNSLKLQWTANSSPLSVVVVADTVAFSTKAPKALAELPPPFDGEALKAVVMALSAPKSMPGGRLKSGAESARVLITNALQAAGVVDVSRACLSDQPDICNVVGRIVGSDATLPKVVVGAHLDHLASAGKKNFPGADDNASGVAVVLEVAAQLVKQQAPRTVEIVFFDGEEAGRLGSRSYVSKQVPSAVFAMVNLDTVGRKGERPLLVLDGDSASEWVHIVRGVGFTTGVQATLAPQGGGASDQQSFLDVGIPAIQLFSGPNADYHQATDTADKVEPASLVAAAVLTREIVGYLRERAEPLTPKNASSSTAGVGQRRASLGSVPDMTFAGPGVRFEDVVAGSAAAKAGLLKGDVLVRFAGQPVADLRGYSELLKTKAPGDKVPVVVRRGDKEVGVDVVLGAR